jgi:hypothetical protein
MRGGGIKENDGGRDVNYIERYFVNVTVYPQYNNNKSKFLKKKI